MGEKLKELREERGMTQEKLAAALKISRSSLALYETNRRQVHNDLLRRLAQFFDVSADYLLGLKEDY